MVSDVVLLREDASVVELLRAVAAVGEGKKVKVVHVEVQK